MQLGGNIELSGFNNLDGASMVVLKKIIGNYARRMSDSSSKFEKLSVIMKPVQDNYEIRAELINDGKSSVSEVVDSNLFIAVDSALKKIAN